MQDKGKNGNNRSLYTALALAGQVGLSIVLPMVFGAFIGQAIDRALHDSVSLATIIGLLLGLAAGIYGVFRLIASVRKTG